MWRWCAYLAGIASIAVALAAVPSVAIVESYVGGSAIHGHIEDGRYFVNPRHGRPVTEVSESTWRTVYRLEKIWPWSALIPCWIGILLLVYGKGPDWKLPPPPPAQMPAWVFRALLVSTWITVGGTLVCLVVVRTPWVVMLVSWILFCICTGSVVRLWTRSLRQQQTAERARDDRFWESIDRQRGPGG